MQILGQADFVIEAINECETSKKAAFLLLDKAGFPFKVQTPALCLPSRTVQYLHSTLLCHSVLPFTLAGCSRLPMLIVHLSLH